MLQNISDKNVTWHTTIEKSNLVINFHHQNDKSSRSGELDQLSQANPRRQFWRCHGWEERPAERSSTAVPWEPSPLQSTSAPTARSCSGWPGTQKPRAVRDLIGLTRHNSIDEPEQIELNKRGIKWLQRTSNFLLPFCLTLGRKKILCKYFFILNMNFSQIWSYFHETKLSDSSFKHEENLSQAH